MNAAAVAAMRWEGVRGLKVISARVPQPGGPDHSCVPSYTSRRERLM